MNYCTQCGREVQDDVFTVCDACFNTRSTPPIVPIESEVWHIYTFSEGMPTLTTKEDEPDGCGPVFCKGNEPDYSRAFQRAARFATLSGLFQGVADPAARMAELLKIEAAYRVYTDALARVAERIRRGDKEVTSEEMGR